MRLAKLTEVLYTGGAAEGEDATADLWLNPAMVVGIEPEFTKSHPQGATTLVTLTRPWHNGTDGHRVSVRGTPSEVAARLTTGAPWPEGDNDDQKVMERARVCVESWAMDGMCAADALEALRDLVG